MSTITDTPEIRITEQGNKIEVALIRGFLKRTLSDDAVVDGVNDLIFQHVVEGRYDRGILAFNFPGFITEILHATTAEDWRAVAYDLIAEARELNAEAD